VISDWIKLTDGSGPIFRQIRNGKLTSDAIHYYEIYRLIKDRSAQSIGESVTPHDLRRTFVTTLLSANIDLNTVRQAAGHQSIQTTAIYDFRNVKKHKKLLSVTDKLCF